MQLNKSMIQKIDIENYFNAEKQAGFVFFIMGAIALFSAIVADYYAKKRTGEYLQKLENHFKNEL